MYNDIFWELPCRRERFASLLLNSNVGKKCLEKGSFCPGFKARRELYPHSPPEEQLWVKPSSPTDLGSSIGFESLLPKDRAEGSHLNLVLHQRWAGCIYSRAVCGREEARGAVSFIRRI